MRIATVFADQCNRVALVDDNSVSLLPGDRTIVEVLNATHEERVSLLDTAEAFSTQAGFGDVDFRPPLIPTTLRDFMTFEQHLAGAIRWVNPGAAIAEEWYAAPCFYFTNPLAVQGDGDNIMFPPDCEVLDFELELAVVLKSGGRDLTIEQAQDCIGGYTILNDWSARDVQTREMRIGLGPVKGKDFASSLGPWIVTPDELEPYTVGDRLDVEMSVSINGVVVGEDSSRHMAWSFAEMIAYASRGAEVAAGDVFGSGTCGSGCLAELWGWAGTQDPPPLVPGDVITLKVQGVGALTNTLVAGSAAVDIPSARRFRSGVRLH